MKDRNVLVTAGSKNLGESIARRFAAAGANVIVNYRSSSLAAELLVDFMSSRFGGKHLAARADVSDAEQVDRMMKEVVDAVGPVDVLVNNAGPYEATPYLEMNNSQWDVAVASNLKASYLMARAVAPGMREKGWGRIVNLSAVSAFVRNRSVYGLAKASIHTLTESLALELAPEVNVNAVAPGQVQESLDEMAGINPEWAESVIRSTPVGRLVTRDEVADLVLALCGPPFDVVTGAVIPVDGGLRLQSF